LEKRRRKSYEKKNPTTIFMQLLRTKTIKNKINNKYKEKNTKKEEKKNLILMWLQVKLRREKEKKLIHKVY
jgi:hypothetical protein